LQWFATPKDAKEFFVGHVLAQAVMESTPLAQDEEYMLWFSAEDGERNDELVQRFEAQRDPADYERRVTGMLRRAYERERQHDPDAEAMWQDGYHVLRHGEHYLVILLKPILQPTPGSRLRNLLRRR
jgi:hypothetical protein